jgi:hypothetical protein
VTTTVVVHHPAGTELHTLLLTLGYQLVATDDRRSTYVLRIRPERPRHANGRCIRGRKT